MALDLEILIIGGFVSFVAKGTEVGEEENVVGPAFYPEDSGDLTAWNDLGCLLEATIEAEEDTTDRFCPSPGGGYIKETIVNVTRDIIKMSLKCENKLIRQLIWGMESVPVVGTPQTPFKSKDRHIEGWLSITGRGQDSQDRVRSVLYGKLRMDGATKWNKDPQAPAVRFEVLYSSIASVEQPTPE